MNKQSFERQRFSNGFLRSIQGAVPLTMIESLGKEVHELNLLGNSVRTIEIDGVEYEIPEGITLLDYIQTDGNCYIDTDVMVTGNEKIQVIFKNNSGVTLNSPILGSLNGSSSFSDANHFSITYVNFESSRMFALYLDGNAAGSGGYCWHGGVSTDSTKQNLIWYGLSGTPTLNDVAMTQAVAAQPIAITPTVGIRLFGRATTAGNGTITQSGIALSLVYVSGKCAFVSAKNSSGAIGMYDFISGTFFANAGSGTFTAGNELPTPEIPLGVKGVGERSENLYCDDVSKWTLDTYSYYPITLKQGKSYRLNVFKKVETPVSNIVIGMVKSGRVYAEFVGLTTCVSYSGTISYQTITVDSSWTDPALVIYKGANTLQQVFDSYGINLVECDTFPTSHIPYGYKFPVRILGANLFDPSTLVSEAGFTETDGVYYRATASGASGKVVWRNTEGYRGQLVLSFDCKYITATTAGVVLNVVYTDGTNDHAPEYSTQQTDWQSYTIVSNPNKVVQYINFGYGTHSAQTYFRRIMLVKGSSVAGYKEYCSTIKTAYRSRQFNRLYQGAVVDMGDLTWIRGQFGSNYFFYMTDLHSIAVYCGKGYISGFNFLSSPNWNMGDYSCYLGNSSSYVVLYLRCDKFTDAASFKAAMKGRYLYYQRTTDSAWYAPIFDQLGVISGADKVRIGKVIFDGTETSWRMDFGTGMFNIQSFTQNVTKGFALCSHFGYNSVNSGIFAALADGEFAIQIYSGVVPNIFFKHEMITDVDAWKDYLAYLYSEGTPLTVWYPLATETAESGTPVAIKTISGTNYLDVETDVEPSELDATYRSRTV